MESKLTDIREKLKDKRWLLKCLRSPWILREEDGYSIRIPKKIMVYEKKWANDGNILASRDTTILDR